MNEQMKVKDLYKAPVQPNSAKSAIRAKVEEQFSFGAGNKEYAPESPVTIKLLLELIVSLLNTELPSDRDNLVILALQPIADAATKLQDILFDLVAKNPNHIAYTELEEEAKIHDRLNQIREENKK
jgi:hypothetical protein